MPYSVEVSAEAGWQALDHYINGTIDYLRARRNDTEAKDRVFISSGIISRAKKNILSGQSSGSLKPPVF